jgi:hypothetical protein
MAAAACLYTNIPEAYILGKARNKSVTLPTPDEFTASSIAHVGCCDL